MSELARLQDAFADALLSTATPIPAAVRGAARGRAERRFAVYRNNVAASLIDALGAKFPVVRLLVGETFFRAMARAYALAEPPRSPLLIEYGASLPAFIEAFAPARPLPYLADMARLELARTRAYHSADVTPLAPASFATLSPARLAAARIALHPSVSIVTSPYPILSIWEAHQLDGMPALALCDAEDVLVARPNLLVETHRLKPGGAAFCLELKTGSTVLEAVAAGMEAAANFTAADSLGILIGSRIAIGIEP